MISEEVYSQEGVKDREYKDMIHQMIEKTPVDELKKIFRLSERKDNIFAQPYSNVILEIKLDIPEETCLIEHVKSGGIYELITTRSMDKTNDVPTATYRDMRGNWYHREIYDFYKKFSVTDKNIVSKKMIVAADQNTSDLKKE
jgi:hypothetical protein